MKTNPEIHITTDGKITYAVLKQDGEVLSRSEAKCHPDDKFDFETGAKIALDRLEIKKKVEQHEDLFKVGDIVEYISDEVSQFDSTYFPPKGTRGEVIELDSHKSVDPCVFVRWEKGTTRWNRQWWCRIKKLKKVDKFPKYSFKVGDRVRFRSWDDMKREFGVDPRCPADICIKKGSMYFTCFMSPLCGTYATIKRIYSSECGFTRVKLTNFSSNTAVLKYSFFVTDMLEPALTKKR